MTTNASTEERLASLEAKLDRISGQLQVLVDAKRPFADFTQDLGPIATEVLRTGIDQCAHLEERGYFDFGRELKYLIDRLVEDYDPRDLHDLADNAANILDTVRTVTQPQVMAAVRDAAEAFDDSHREPVGLFGAYRVIKKDKNVQRGLAFALDALGRVGRAVSRAPRMSRSDQAVLAKAAARPALAPSTPVRKSSPPSAPTVVAESPGASTDADRFVPDSEWNRELARERALSRGLADLSDAQFELVECARDAHGKTGATPNIRKITHLSGKSTREIYALFPKAPGLTIAYIAGVPKPVGCL